MCYLYLKGAAYGPYTEEQVRGMVGAGRVNGNTLVFRQGGAQQWLPARDFPELMRPLATRGGPAPTDPTVTSIPVGHHTVVERVVWEGRPSAWTLCGQVIKYFASALMAVVACVLVVVNLPDAKMPGFGSDEGLVLGIIALSFCLCVVFAVPLFWQWLRLKTTKFTLTTERFTYAFGVFSRQTENLELYRIKDFTVREPFWLRLVGFGYVDVVTSDMSDRTLLERWPNKRSQAGVGAVRKPQDLAVMFRKYAERERQRHGVREIDIS